VLFYGNTTASSVVSTDTSGNTTANDTEPNPSCTAYCTKAQSCCHFDCIATIHLRKQVEFVVLVNKAGVVVVAPENVALNGTAWDPANIVSDVLSTGNGYTRRYY
jgi:hypothetical protein